MITINTLHGRISNGALLEMFSTKRKFTGENDDVNIDSGSIIIPKRAKLIQASSFSSRLRNIEIFTGILLHVELHSSKILEQKMRSAIDYICIFDSADECEEYMRSIKNEIIILIVHNRLAETFISRVTALQQLNSIYIYEDQATPLSTVTDITTNDTSRTETCDKVSGAFFGDDNHYMFSLIDKLC